MGVRFRANIETTFNQVAYTVEIIDPSWSSTGVTELTLFGEGFELSYLQEGDERFAPIKGSEVQLNIEVTNNPNGLAIQSWILNSLINQKEQFYLQIKKEGALFWYGIFLPDLSQRDDISRPYSYVIKATDGLARLKDTEFSLASQYAQPGGPTARKTFIELIWECLKYTPLYSTTETLLFSTVVGWYESQMPSKDGLNDPLALAEVKPNAYAVQGEDNVWEGLSVYETLSKICETWGMRCIMSDGWFRFYQVSSYADDSIQKYERQYRRSNGGLYDAIEFSGYNLSVTNTSFPHVKAGGAFTNFPPLKYCYLKYTWGKLSNMLDSTETMTLSGTYKYSEVLRDNIIGGTGKSLRFTTVLRLFFPIANIGKRDVAVSIKLKLGSKYLKKDPLGAVVSWTTTSTDRYEVVLHPPDYESVCYLNISFETPPIPAGTYDTNEFEIDVTGVTDSVTSATLTPATQYNIVREVGSTVLRYVSSDNGNGEEYYEYIASNTASVINSYDIQLEDSNIGEPLDVANPGNIFVYTGSAWVMSAGGWRVEDTGSEYDFNLIRVRDVVAGQLKATFKYQGIFIGSDILPHSSVNYDGYRFILNGGTMSALSEEFSGEWFQVSYDYDSTDDNGGTILNGNGGDQQLRREIGSVQDSVYNIYGQLQQNGVVTTGVSNSVTLTSLSQIAYSTGTVTFYLAPAADWVVNGMSSIIDIVNTGNTGGVITVIPDGSETIYGETSITLNNGESACLWSDGNNIWAK